LSEGWRTIASLLSREFGVEVLPSQEGWGAGYDPGHLPLLERWALGEVEEIPQEVKRPRGVVFDIREFSGKEEGFVAASVGHEIVYLLETPFPNWRHGQREVLRAGYPPASFSLLLAVLESLRATEILLSTHPSRRRWLEEKMDALLPPRVIHYPHQRFVRSLVDLWLGRGKGTGLRESIGEYLEEKDPAKAYDVLMGEIWSRYRPLVDRSRELNRIDLLLEEAGRRSRENVHRGRIMTDLLRKLPPRVQEILYRNRSASDMEESERREILRALSSVPGWMREYLEQMSFLDITERDLRLIRNLLPRTLEVDIEHRGFLTFLFKSWEGSVAGGRRRGDVSGADYGEILKSVLPHVEYFRKRFSALLPVEEERWGGSYTVGRRLDHRRLSREVPTGRGRLYRRREVPVQQKLAFELLIDLSSSMKRNNRIGNALRALVLVCEVLHSLGMPFSVKVFNDRVFTVKEFGEDYRSVRPRLTSLTERVGGGTDLSGAVLSALEDLTLYTRKANLKGVIVLFTDGAPTRGLKGEELRKLIRETKRRIPLVGVGTGTSQVREFFEGTAVSVDSISQLPAAFALVLENRLRRILRNR